MKRLIALPFAVGLISAAWCIHHTSSLDAFQTAIHSAKSLDTNYVYQEIGGSRQQFTVALKKPNLVRIDSDDQLIVADGTKVTTLDKKAKTYYSQPETGPLLSELLSSEPVKTWRGFFDDDAYKAFVTNDTGTASRGGKDYQTVKVQMDQNGVKTVTYYLDPSDSIARLVEFNTKHGTDLSTSVLRTRTLEVNGVGADSQFTFAPPADGQEISLADVLAGKWYTSLSEAEKIATAAHSHIFIDFMATWCGPCKMLQHEVLETDKFKQYAAAHHLVLCRIDTDLNPDLMSHYGITAIPVQAVVDDKGATISQTVGYGGADAFYSWLSSAVG